MARLRPLTWLKAAVALAIALPFLAWKYMPCTDLVGHVAIGATLWQLVTGQGAGYYALNLQPIPYWLVYVLIAPLGTLLGPIWGAKAVALVLTLGTAYGGFRVLDSVKAAPWSYLGVVFLAFHLTFFWGFVSTLMGLPFVLLGLAHLLENLEARQARHTAAAAAFGALAILSHVILIVPWAVFLACYLVASRGKQWKDALVAGVGMAIPALPALLKFGQAKASPPVIWPTRAEMYGKLLQQMHSVKIVAGKGAHVAFWLLLVGLCVWVVYRQRRALSAQRALLEFACSPDSAPPGKLLT